MVARGALIYVKSNSSWGITEPDGISGMSAALPTGSDITFTYGSADNLRIVTIRNCCFDISVDYRNGYYDWDGTYNYDPNRLDQYRFNFHERDFVLGRIIITPLKGPSIMAAGVAPYPSTAVYSGRGGTTVTFTRSDSYMWGITNPSISINGGAYQNLNWNYNDEAVIECGESGHVSVKWSCQECGQKTVLLYPGMYWIYSQGSGENCGGYSVRVGYPSNIRQVDGHTYYS